MSSQEIKTGDPVILVDARGLKKYGLTRNMGGFCNSLVTVPEEGEYLMFQPEGVVKFFWVEASRFILDEEKMNAMKGGDDEQRS